MRVFAPLPEPEGSDPTWRRRTCGTLLAGWLLMALLLAALITWLTTWGLLPAP